VALEISPYLQRKSHASVMQGRVEEYVSRQFGDENNQIAIAAEIS
jgi:hypothetical protein